MVKIGPAGGPGGQDFGRYLIPKEGKLREIHVFTDDLIDAVQFVYQISSGGLITMPRLGGEGGSRQVFVLDNEEYLIGINGRYGWFLDSLNLHTNLRSSPEFGGGGGEYDFLLNAPPGTEIVGLFGRSGWFLDALGIIARERNMIPVKKRPPLAKRGSGPGELQKVRGIGPRIAVLLTDRGITSLRQLAWTDPEELAAILTEAGGRFSFFDPSSWPEQAALAARGDWKGLADLQEKLQK